MDNKKGGRQMTCKEAESLVIPYIHHQLDDDTMSEFLEHIEVCPNCKEELEIYYTVEAGIRQLDKDTGHYNIKGDMEADLQASRQRLHGIHVLDVARYAADTLIVISVAMMLVLQVRIWWQCGIF